MLTKLISLTLLIISIKGSSQTVQSLNFTGQMTIPNNSYIEFSKDTTQRSDKHFYYKSGYINASITI